MVQVQVQDGILEGEIVENPYGGTFCSFKGIPYAAPPVGDLRFEVPQPPKPWKGVKNAKDFGPVCFQFNPLGSDTPIGSEDCLYINVYTPNVKPPRALPVMFWIHGGGFVYGGGNDDVYGPEFLIRHDVVLVTFNYRLEALGFLSLDTEEIPGNAGMKDQVAALRWVKRNISQFGGDPDNVTIFGESAGGAAVGYHLISPMTKGLFRRAIMQSGTAASWWGQAFEPREKALTLARQLGCQSKNDKELYEFFKSQPLEKLVRLRMPVVTNHKLYEIEFGVTNEKQFGDSERFFYADDVIDAVKKNAHEGVDVIIGYTKDEGLLSLVIQNSKLETFIDLANNYLEFFTPVPIKHNCSIKHQLEAGRKLKEFYFKNDGPTRENSETLFRFLNWDMFNHDIFLQRDILASDKNRKVYMYKFSCLSERNIMKGLFKLNEVVGDRDVVCHGEDVSYLFDGRIMRAITPKLKATSDTFKMIDNMTKMWTNFAKYGNPTPDESLGAKWLPHTSQNQEFLTITKHLEPGNKPDEQEYVFWGRIFKEFLPPWTV